MDTIRKLLSAVTLFRIFAESISCSVNFIFADEARISEPIKGRKIKIIHNDKQSEIIPAALGSQLHTNVVCTQRQLLIGAPR